MKKDTLVVVVQNTLQHCSVGQEGGAHTERARWVGHPGLGPPLPLPRLSRGTAGSLHHPLPATSCLPILGLKGQLVGGGGGRWGEALLRPWPCAKMRDAGSLHLGSLRVETALAGSQAGSPPSLHAELHLLPAQVPWDTQRSNNSSLREDSICPYNSALTSLMKKQLDDFVFAGQEALLAPCLGTGDWRWGGPGPGVSPWGRQTHTASSPASPHQTQGGRPPMLPACGCPQMHPARYSCTLHPRSESGATFVPCPPKSVLIAFKLISNKQHGTVPSRGSNLLEMRKPGRAGPWGFLKEAQSRLPHEVTVQWHKDIHVCEATLGVRGGATKPVCGWALLSPMGCAEGGL